MKVAVDLLHFEADQPVVEQDAVADFDGAPDLLIVQVDGFVRDLFLVVGIGRYANLQRAVLRLQLNFSAVVL